eukprot:2188299-Amphidinium_carterae.2
MAKTREHASEERQNLLQLWQERTPCQRLLELSKPKGSKRQNGKGGKGAGGASTGKGKGKTRDAGALDEEHGAEPVSTSTLGLCHAVEAVENPLDSPQRRHRCWWTTKAEGKQGRTYKTATGELKL